MKLFNLRDELLNSNDVPINKEIQLYWGTLQFSETWKWSTRKAFSQMLQEVHIGSKKILKMNNKEPKNKMQFCQELDLSNHHQQSITKFE